MRAKPGTCYDQEFYSQQLEGSLRSARVILEILYKMYQPRSVVDFGCGRGAWLAVAESLGSRTMKGFDGAWIKKEALISKNIEFVAVDLWKDFDVTTKYDLAISVEVAEHLPEKQARTFVAALCKASDVVVFSAATKYQGGVNHINEQWQSYWTELFSSNDYACFDIFRWRIWHDEHVEWWYRQNVFLFLNRNSRSMNQSTLQSEVRPIIDAVHPLTYAAKAEIIDNPTFRFCIGCMRRYVLLRIRRLVRKSPGC